MESCGKAESDMVANNEVDSADPERLSKGNLDDLPSSSSRQTSPVLFIGPLANPNLAVETRYIPRDVKDPMAVNGSCGLYNLGNTCFMNAGLQALASSSPLLKFFFEEFQLTEGLKGTLTGAFYQLLVRMWSGRYSLVQPRHFKDLLGLYHPQFQDYRQHDCQEFLALLLDTFHEQLNRRSPLTSLSTPSVTQPPAAPTDSQGQGQGQGHLNNKDLGGELVASGKVEQSECPVTSADPGHQLLCPETLSAEEDLGGTSAGPADVSPRSSQGHSSVMAESGQGRSSLKRVSSSSTEAVMASLFSEDSNHSTLSAHSTDSEQSNAFKKLKIEADSTTCGGVSLLSSVSELCTQETPLTDAASGASGATPAAVAGKESSAADNNNSAESGAESMEMSVPAHPSIPQRKCVRLDIPSSSQGTSFSMEQTVNKVTKEQVADSDLSGDGVDKWDRGKPETGSLSASLKKFNNTDLPAPTSVLSDGVMASPPGQTCQNDLPAMTSSPQDASRTNPLHFYCKETKTLNTNVLVSNFVQGDVSTDSEKFAKVDNRNQVPVSKEVNLLQEALHGLEEDKVEKALIGKTLGSGNSSHLMTTPEGREEKSEGQSSNLRTVKSRQGGGLLCKSHTTDPHLLNNSYEYEEDVLVGYSGLVDSALQKTDSRGMACMKPSLDCGVGEKMEVEGGVSVDKVSSEVEKNVQMQALAKLKNTLTKSNIREDISDKASTSESTETEDGDMEVEAEESSASEDEGEEEEEPPSRGSVVGDNSNSNLTNPACCFTAADVTAANAAWESYKACNNSVVVDTFQGQFKSTVVCSECDHVSVTYEPFMYLSLPIPHAMERQICVVYVRPYKSTVRYMLTLHKNDKVQQLRRQLQTMTGTENCDVIIAEVLDNHISRILDENIMLRYVNDTTRTIHAFQMLPPPEMPQEPVGVEEDQVSASPFTPNIPSPQPETQGVVDEAAAASTEPFIQPLTIDVSGGQAEALPLRSPSPLLSAHQVEDVLNASGEVERSRLPSASEAAMGLNEEQQREKEGEGVEAASKLDCGDWSKFGGEQEACDLPPEGADPMLMGTGLWEWNHRDDFMDDPPPHVSAPPTSPTSQHSGTFAPTDLHLNVDYSSEALFPQSPSSMDVEMDHIPSASDLANPQMWPGPDDLGDKAGGEAGAGCSSMMDQWQTCAICLEELMDSHLLTHQDCKGVFCHSCLEMSAKHSGDLANSCPVCLNPVDVTQDFVPLASSSTVKSKVRLLAMAVTFRTGPLSSLATRDKPSEGEIKLVCGPRLTYMASQQDASALYTLVDHVVPFVETYSLHFTDGQGLRCSRCEYSAHCTGCEVAREGEISLQPCDNLTVHFKDELPLEEMEAKIHVSDDDSIQHLRSSNAISISDCFEAFTQSEVLDEHNPWYCPCCERNQCAKKTMTVWRYPDNLIIHLKRFVYEDLSSTKIDNRVVFPFTSLDVGQFLAGPSTSFNIYDLYSIVCHYGGANSGHYTAFCCHPMTNEWYNYNDETVSQQKPGDSEFDSSYILFFRRQGCQLEFHLVNDPPALEEEEYTADFPASSGPMHGPAPTSPELSTTAIVTFETEGFSILSDSNQPGPSEAENHSYDFYN